MNTLPNSSNHLLGLELQHGGDGMCLAHTLLISFNSDEPVGPGKNEDHLTKLCSLESLVDLCAWHHQLVRGVGFKTS